MNRPVLTRSTGTPELRAALASPPAAKIQLPTRVRSRTQVASDGEADEPEDRHRHAVDLRHAVRELVDEVVRRRARRNRPLKATPENRLAHDAVADRLVDAAQLGRAARAPI